MTTAETLAEALCAAMPHPGGGSLLVYEDALEAAQKALASLETRYEYRAYIRRPWNILDPKVHQERGWMEEAVVLKRKEDVKNVYEIKRSEETWAYVHRWERRPLIEGTWEEES